MFSKSLIATLLAFSFTFANPCSQNGPETRKPTKDDTVYEVSVLYPEFVSVPKTHTVEGVLDVSEITTITASAGGTVDQIFVSEGDSVSIDDPIISLSNSDLIDFIDVKRAKIKEYNARLKSAQEKLDLYGNEDQPASLQDTNFLDEEPVDEPVEKEFGDTTAPKERPSSIKALIELLENSVDRLTKEADILDRRLLELNHVSPVAGVVTKVYVSESNKVKQQDKLMDISQTNPMSIAFHLPQDEASFVDKHSQVQVSPLDAPTVKGQGQVYYIDPNLNTGTNTIEVKAHVSNDDGKIKGGQKATVWVTTRKINRVILLPKKALYYEEGKIYVFIIYRDRAKLVEVTTGEEDDKGNIQIFGDLRVDDPVIVDRPLELHHNSFVKIHDTKNVDM